MIQLKDKERFINVDGNAYPLEQFIFAQNVANFSGFPINISLIGVNSPKDVAFNINVNVGDIDTPTFIFNDIEYTFDTSNEATLYYSALDIVNQFLAILTGTQIPNEDYSLIVIGAGLGTKDDYDAYFNGYGNVLQSNYDAVLDKYTFDYPTNTTIVSSFMVGQKGQFWAKTDMITNYGDNAFENYTGSVLIDSIVAFGDNAFSGATGDNIIGAGISFLTYAFAGAEGNNKIGATCSFRDYAFSASTGNNIIGDGCSFETMAFSDVTGDNTIGNNIHFQEGAFNNAIGLQTIGDDTDFASACFSLSTATVSFLGKVGFSGGANSFADARGDITFHGAINIVGTTDWFLFVNSIATINIRGAVGSTTARDFQINTTGFTGVLNALTTQATDNGGNPEGDIDAFAIANGITVNYVL